MGRKKGSLSSQQPTDRMRLTPPSEGREDSTERLKSVRLLVWSITGVLMEIVAGVPDADARASILNVLLAKTPHTLTQDEIRTIASRAHGYVGADLSAVVREAGTSAIKRWLASYPSDPSSSSSSSSEAKLTFDDLANALLGVRPSALRSVFLDTARVRYADIGGQAATIQKLRECVEWPVKHPEAFERLGVKAPKGVLLYGPPGCSKTMLVRALATESGVNFVAVKGPEVRLRICDIQPLELTSAHSCSTNTLASPNAPCARYSGRPGLLRLQLSSS